MFTQVRICCGKQLRRILFKCRESLQTKVDMVWIGKQWCEVRRDSANFIIDISAWAQNTSNIWLVLFVFLLIIIKEDRNYRWQSILILKNCSVNIWSIFGKRRFCEFDYVFIIQLDLLATDCNVVHVQNWPTDKVCPAKWHFDSIEIIYLIFNACSFKKVSCSILTSIHLLLQNGKNEVT